MYHNSQWVVNQQLLYVQLHYWPHSVLHYHRLVLSKCWIIQQERKQVQQQQTLLPEESFKVEKGEVIEEKKKMEYEGIEETGEKLKKIKFCLAW